MGSRMCHTPQLVVLDFYVVGNIVTWFANEFYVADRSIQMGISARGGDVSRWLIRAKI